MCVCVLSVSDVAQALQLPIGNCHLGFQFQFLLALAFAFASAVMVMFTGQTFRCADKPSYDESSILCLSLRPTGCLSHRTRLAYKVRASVCLSWCTCYAVIERYEHCC